MNIVDFFDAEFVLGTAINGSGGAVTEVVAVTAAPIRRMQIADTTGLFLAWYVGAAAAEVLTAVSGPGTDNTVDLEIAAGERISVRSLDTTAGVSGQLTCNFLG